MTRRLHAAESRASERNKADTKHTSKRLTPSHSSRASDLISGQTQVSIPSFLARFLPDRQTHRQIQSISSFPDSHPAGLCALYKSLNKKKKKSACSNSAAHYSSLQKRKAPRARSYLLLTKVSETISSGC